MTVPGAVGDEWINQADRLEWVHDGTTWQRRPFTDRILASDTKRLTSDIVLTSEGWTRVPGGSVPIDKTLDDTDLLIFGSLTGWSTGHYKRVKLLVWPSGSGAIPALTTFHAHFHFTWQNEMNVPFQARFPNVPKGQQTVNLYASSTHFKSNTHDCWQITVMEVPAT
jgi:hypothetical protein